MKRARAELVYTGPDSFLSSNGIGPRSTLFTGSGELPLATTDRIEGLPGVYRAINLISGLLGALEMRAYKRSDRKVVRSKILEHPGGDFIFSPYEWREYEARSRLTRGNSYAFKLGMTQASPFPSRLAPISPTRVIPAGVFRNGVLVDTVYFVSAQSVDQLAAVTDEQIVEEFPMFTRREIFHVPGQMYDGVSGMSPIDAMRLSLSIEASSEEAAGKFYSKGSLLSGFLHTEKKLDEVTAEKLKARWQKKMSGVDTAYDIAVMDNGLKFEPITVAPADAEWVQSRNFNLEQIARAFGVPPFLLMIAASGQSFGTGLEQQLTGLELFTLNNWMRPVEDRFTLEILPGTQYAQYDRSPLDRADTKSLYAAMLIARNGGFMSVDEVRERVGKPPIGTDDSQNPMLPPPKGASADQPGGNQGLQGGGSESDLGQTDPTDENP